MKPSQRNIRQIEDWLNILITTYRDSPSIGLAKVINYYIERIINEDELKQDSFRLCQYQNMKKFWSWKSLQGIRLTVDEM